MQLSPLSQRPYHSQNPKRFNHAVAGMSLQHLFAEDLMAYSTPRLRLFRGSFGLGLMRRASAHVSKVAGSWALRFLIPSKLNLRPPRASPRGPPPKRLKGWEPPKGPAKHSACGSGDAWRRVVTCSLSALAPGGFLRCAEHH